MTNDLMHASKNKSVKMNTSIPGELGGELSYSHMLIDQNGTVMREDQIQAMREKQGYCTTCKGTPVKLFEVRKTKLNPLWKSKEPLTVPNECYKGLCLKCNPDLQKSAGTLFDQSASTLMSSRSQLVDGSTRSMDNPLTVTRFRDSSHLGSVLESSKTSSFNSSSLRTSEQRRADSFMTSGSALSSRDYVGASFVTNKTMIEDVSGVPVEHHDVYKSTRPKNSSPPRDQRIDSLSLSRRNSVPIPSKPTFDYKVPTTLKYTTPLKGRARKSRQGMSGKASSETMDRLRAAYERTFSQMSMDEISALTLDLGQSSSGVPRKGSSDDSDSLLEEFSVPDFSMGTGDAVKSHRTIPHEQHYEPPAPLPAEPKLRTPEKQRKSIDSSGAFDEFPQPTFNEEISPIKPKVKPVSSAAKKPKKHHHSPKKKYAIMDSTVSAIPGPTDITPSKPEQRSLDPPSQANPSLKTEEHQEPLPDTSLTKSMKERIASMPSYEDGSTALAPPSLIGMNDTVGDITVESDEPKSNKSGLASVNSKLEEVESLINDCMAAENAEFLADLLGNTMRSHREREDIQALCLRTIWELSKYNLENKGCIMSTGLYECIVTAMKDHPESVDVQENGCGALWSLSVNQFNRVILVRSGACERILRALNTHLNHEGFVQTALGALRTLSPEPEARMVLSHLLGNQRVVRAMALHRPNINIQRDGCACLSNIAVDMENQEVSVVSKEELQAVVRAMADHLKNESVVTSACFALKNYTYEEINIRNLRRFEDVVSLLEDAAQYATKASCRRDAAEVLKRIRLLRTEDDALEETAFSSLMQAMRRHAMDPNPARQVEESVSTITEIIKEYYWSVKLICFGLESLLSLAAKSDAHRTRILSPNTLRVVVTTMKEHKSNSKVQQRGCELIKYLAEPDLSTNRVEICREEGCAVIVSALKTHRGDEPVQIPAYAALKALADEPLCSEEIQRSGGWQIIRETERERRQNEDEGLDDSDHKVSYLSSNYDFDLPAAS